MKRRVIIFTVFMVFGAVAHAGPGLFAGITYIFDQPSQLGITLKALASRNDDQPTAAIGLNVSPLSQGGLRYGFDVGVGYQKDDAAVLVGYDLVLQRTIASIGYADLKSD